MKISGNYLNQNSYVGSSKENTSKSSETVTSEKNAGSIPSKDTVTISVAGKQFAAERIASDSEMGTLRLTSDLESFRSALRSMNEPLPVNWEASVDPFGTFRSFAKIESRLQQLQDPTASKQDAEMDRIADEYANQKINELIEKKKTMINSGMVQSKSDEYVEYKIAYDAYHSANGKNLIESLSGDAKKAYDIYKNILDNVSVPIEDEEFLMLHNGTMYIGAKSEAIRNSDALYSAINNYR